MDNKRRLDSTGPASIEQAATMASAQVDTNIDTNIQAQALTKRESKAGGMSENLSSANTKTRKKKRGKRYNCFNIFFMLERQLLLRSRGGGINVIENPIDPSHLLLVQHKDLNLPPLCQRYNQLPLTKNWFLELKVNQKGKNRAHKKSHGLVSFSELAQVVAKNYREIDEDTQAFITKVMDHLNRHYNETEAIEKATETVAQTRPMKKMKSPPMVSSSTAPTATSENTSLIVFGGKRGPLSHDEAEAVHQLMDMNTQYSTMPVHNTRQVSASRPPVYPQAVKSACSQEEVLLHNPSHIQASHQSVYPAPSHPAPEGRRFRLEKAASINVGLDTERRLQPVHIPSNLRELSNSHDSNSRVPVPHSSTHIQAGYQAVYPQATSLAGSHAHILRLEASRAMKSHLETERTRQQSTVDVTANLPEPPRLIDSESQYLELELTRVWNARFENDRKIEVTQRLQEQMELKNYSDVMMRIRQQESLQYPQNSHESPQGHLQACDHHLPMPGGHGQYFSNQPDRYIPLPEAMAVPMPTFSYQAVSQRALPVAASAVPTQSPKEPETFAFGVSDYLVRLEEELLHEAFDRGIISRETSIGSRL